MYHFQILRIGSLFLGRKYTKFRKNIMENSTKQAMFSKRWYLQNFKFQVSFIGFTE